MSLKRLYLLSSEYYKTPQTTGCPLTSKLGTFLLWSLALNMPIYINFSFKKSGEGGSKVVFGREFLSKKCGEPHS